MLKTIKRLLERSRYVVCILLTLLIVYLSLVKTTNIVVPLNVSDKSLHGLAYFGLSFSWIFAVRRSHSNLKWKLLIGFGMFLLGVFLEFLQGSITDYRTSDYFDVVANIVGIVFAVLLSNNLLRLYHSF